MVPGPIETGAAPQLGRLLEFPIRFDGGTHAHRGHAAVKTDHESKQTLELWLCPRLAEGRQNYHRPSRVEFDATRTLPGRQAVGM